MTHSVSQHLSTIEYITRVLCNLEMVMHNTGEIAAKCMIFLFILAYLDYGNARISMTGSILVAFQGYKDMLIGNEVAEIGTFLLEDNEDSKRMIEVMRTP